MRNLLFGLYRYAQRFICPGLIYSKDIYYGVIENACMPKISWLDLGCGHKLFPANRANQWPTLLNNDVNLFGIDADINSLSKHQSIKKLVAGDITKLPFKDGVFDLVTANMVFEHLEAPREQLIEIRRTMKANGTLLFHTPNKLGYTTIAAMCLPDWLKSPIAYFLMKRKSEDIYPTHYKINTKKKLDTIISGTGFEIEFVKGVANHAQFAIILPIAILELLWIKITLTPLFSSLRTSIIVSLKAI